MKLKITKERLDQIMQEEYQRIQEEKKRPKDFFDTQTGRQMIYDPGHKDADSKGFRPETTAERDKAVQAKLAADAEREAARKQRTDIAAAKRKVVEPIVRGMRGLEEEEHAEPVGAGIEDISADDVLGNQPGLGFDLGSQEAFRLLYTQYDGGRNKAQIGKDFEKIAQIDPKLSDVFKALILSNPILFPDETPGSVDLLRNDPEAVEAALAAIPDELPEGPPESEEDMDSLVKDIQRLLKQQGNL